MAKKKEKTLLDKMKLNFNKILIGSIILNVLFLLFGVIIYLNSRITIELTGIIRDGNPLFRLNIFWGVLSIIAGLFVIINPFEFVKILTFTLGIYLLIISIRKIIDAFKLKKYEYDGWALMLAIAIILLIFGIFIIINPMASMDLVEATGIFIILASILEICNSIQLYTKANEVLNLFKNEK